MKSFFTPIWLLCCTAGLDAATLRLSGKHALEARVGKVRGAGQLF